MTDFNSFPDLIEVLMRVMNSNDSDHRDVRVELRVANVTLATDDNVEFVVELDRAHLSLDLDGFEVVPKSRFGEPSKSNDLSVERKRTTEATRQGEVSGSFEGSLTSQPSASMSAKAAGSVAKKTMSSGSSAETEKLLRVKARGNLRWEVTEPELDGSLSKLSDTYLNDDVLCKIEALPGANLLAVRLAAFARKRDIRITPRERLGAFRFKSRNHEIMLNAVIAKALSHDKSNGGILTFCVSEIMLEDDPVHR